MGNKDREELRQLVVQAVTNAFKLPLEEVEIFIASFASALEADSAEKLEIRFKKLQEVQEAIRRKVLRMGNDEVRAIEKALDNYHIKKKRYDKIYFD